jgi:hypothetical protein
VWRSLATLLCPGLFLMLAACSPAKQQPPLQTFPNGFEGSALQLRNGGAVAVGQGLRTEVFLDPFPATGQSVWIDLYVERQGRPVDGATVTAENEMAYMSHGSTHQDGTNSGGGHYQLVVHYPMIGPWRHRISIQVAEQRYELPIEVTVYP